MSYTRPKIRRQVSQRSVRNLTAFWAGGTEMEASKARPRGKQPESEVGKSNRQWAAIRGGVLRKNRRGMVDLASGAKMPIGLSEPLILDEVGYLPILITPAMVGKRLPILCHIEDKTDSGVVADHQQACVDELMDANAIVGVSRGPHDCEDILARWHERVSK